MDRDTRKETGFTGENGRDPRIEGALRAFDPAGTDPGYWFRFHRAVMSAAERELGRRRMLADVTVSELVVSWGRAVVPTAVLAAAAALVLVFGPMRGPTQSSVDLAVTLEEMLLDEAWGDAPDLDEQSAVVFTTWSF